MSIQKDNNGSYIVQYDIVDVITGKKKRTKKRGFNTLREAKEFERSLSREESDVLFISLFEELQKTTKQEPETYDGKISIINKYIPNFKTIKYSQLTKPYLLQVRTEIASKDVSPTTKNKVIGIIKSTCKYANKIYDLVDNSKILDRFKDEKKEFDVWTPEEYFMFENALKGSRYEKTIPYFRTLFFTGLRKGEARALTVDDLDVDKATLTVTKSVRINKNRLKPPKNASSVRKIKIDINTFELLKPLKSHYKWLFGDIKPLSKDVIEDAFIYGKKISGVKPIRIHDLRHSHATYLILNGANIVAVSKRLGHKKIETTLSTYTHLFENSENELIEILNVANL